jgi:signal recognition particle GTPase
MTPFEKENPETINQSRRTRIAKGSGTDLAEVNRLMKQFDDMKKVMKQMSNPAAMAKHDAPDAKNVSGLRAAIIQSRWLKAFIIRT